MSQLQSMPALGMGTFRLECDVAYQSVKMALEAGYRHIDTAQIYSNEAEVGQAIMDSGIPREELFVTTKVWNSELTEAAVKPSVETSLKKLQLEHVDLLLVHWPSPPEGTPMEEYLNAMLAVKEVGYTREIGVSNFTVAQLKEAQKILPAGTLFTNQVEVHPYLTNETLRTYAKEAGIHITAYMPFAVGKVLKDKVIVGIAEKYQVSPAEIVIAWVLAHEMATIPSSTKRENLETNLNALSLKLSAEDIKAIDALNQNDRQAAPDFSPEWD